MATLNKEELGIVTEALDVYGAEVGKLMKKADKLKLKSAPKLKEAYLDTVALRERLIREG